MIIVSDCTRNIYGRLCSQIAYFLPNDCFGDISCETECKEALERQVSQFKGSYSVEGRRDWKHT